MALGRCKASEWGSTETFPANVCILGTPLPDAKCINPIRMESMWDSNRTGFSKTLELQYNQSEGGSSEGQGLKQRTSHFFGSVSGDS